MGWFADRRPRLPLMAGGLVGMGAVIVFAGTAPTPAAVALVLVAVAVAYSFVLVPALPEIASVVHTTGSRGYAMAYGAFNIAYALGMVLGPTAGSAATTWRALPTVLIGTGLLLAVTGLLLQARLRHGLADAISRCLRPGAEPRRQHHPTHQ